MIQHKKVLFMEVLIPQRGLLDIKINSAYKISIKQTLSIIANE